MSPELELGLWAAGVVGLFVALVVWIIRDWWRGRRRRQYWTHRYWVPLVRHREICLARARARVAYLDLIVHDYWGENYWENNFEPLILNRLKEIRNNPPPQREKYHKLKRGDYE